MNHANANTPQNLDIYIKAHDQKTPGKYQQLKEEIRRVWNKNQDKILNTVKKTGGFTEIAIFENTIKKSTRKRPTASIWEDEPLLNFIIRHNKDYEETHIKDIMEAHLELLIVEIDLGLTTCNGENPT